MVKKFIVERRFLDSFKPLSIVRFNLLNKGEEFELNRRLILECRIQLIELPKYINKINNLALNYMDIEGIKSTDIVGYRPFSIDKQVANCEYYNKPSLSSIKLWQK